MGDWTGRTSVRMIGALSILLARLDAAATGRHGLSRNQGAF